MPKNPYPKDGQEWEGKGDAAIRVLNKDEWKAAVALGKDARQNPWPPGRKNDGGKR